MLFRSGRGRSAIGRVHGFYGNVGVLVRAYTYIRTLGREGLIRSGRTAIINANYLRSLLQSTYPVPFDHHSMHEFVASAKPLKAHGVNATDLAKRLLDYGFYAPTVYFPLTVEEAMMIEPTETESKEMLDEFVRILHEIEREIDTDPKKVTEAPHDTPVSRIDEVTAARHPNLRYKNPVGNGRDRSLPKNEPREKIPSHR